MEQEFYIELIGRYLSNDISPADETALMEWVRTSDSNQKFFDEMVQLWDLSSEYVEPEFEVNITTAWDSLDHKIDLLESENGHGATGNVRRLSVIKRSWQYAAAILLLVTASYWVYTSMDTQDSPSQWVSVITGPGEQQQVVLPDSSIVLLNEQSELAYASDFTKREVELSGEAFFEVTKREGKSFTIYTDETTTRVLGTSFNVRAYPEEPKVEVSVSTGKVALSKKVAKEQQSSPEDRLELEAGQSGVYYKSEKELDVALVPNANAWKTKELNFDNIQLRYLEESLERYFNIEVAFEDEQLKNCLYMGSFPDPTLEKVIAALEFTMELKVKKINGQYLISGDAAQCQ